MQYAAAAIACALAILGIKATTQESFRATIAFPLFAELALYHRNEDRLQSLAEFKNFITAYEIQNISINGKGRNSAHAIQQRLKYENSFRMSRSDWRELPDTSQSKVAADNLKSNRTDLTVSINESDAAKASEFATVGIRFARHILLHATITDWLQDQLSKIDAEFNETRSAELSLTATADSLTRRFDAYQELKKKYRDTASSPNTGVQVQITNPRFLSIDQQLLALDAERIDLKEEISKQREYLARIETIKKLLGAFQEDYRAEPNVEKLLLKLHADSAAAMNAADKAKASQPVRLGLAEITQQLASHRQRFVERVFTPPTPSIKVSQDSNASMLGVLAVFAALGAALIAWQRSTNKASQSV